MPAQVMCALARIFVNPLRAEFFRTRPSLGWLPDISDSSVSTYRENNELTPWVLFYMVHISCFQFLGHERKFLAWRGNPRPKSVK
jgi:hypothetical protein